MGIMKVPKGQHFIKQNDKITQLYLIIQGKVRQVQGKDAYLIENNNLVGLSECLEGNYQDEYIAEEDCILYPFAYEKPQDFLKIFEEQPKYAVAFLQAALRQAREILEEYEHRLLCAEQLYAFIMEAYRNYCTMCRVYKIPEQVPYHLEELAKPQTRQQLGEWEIAYFKELSAMPAPVLEQFFGQKHTLVTAELVHTARTIHMAMRLMKELTGYLEENREVLLRERGNDLLDLYQQLATEVAQQGQDVSAVLKRAAQIKNYMNNSGLYEKELLSGRIEEFDGQDYEALRQSIVEDAEDGEESEDCLEHILKFVAYDETQMAHVRELLQSYQELTEDYSTDDEARKLRRELTTIFYDIYKKAFKISLQQEELSPIMQMFFAFGFLDVQTAGEENANELYDLTEELDRCRSQHVFTMYDWLLAIYHGEEEPSRNEFDLDYNGYLQEEKRMGRITAEDMQRMKNDNWEKVCYEMDNMFMSANRATYGKISTFCPILNEADIIGDVTKLLVTAEKLEAVLNQIRGIDFSLFYQEVIFSDPEHGVNKEMIYKEVLPYVILMPNAGTRAMMWQETAGSKRDTPARFVFPILTAVSLEDLMLGVCGRYRWEICRKVQGMRWNDITEPSLTSEYCDYIQFYRKNHDLSAEAKEKIKNALSRAKNNYREVFVMDYISWIRYEAKGSFRLNRLARDILFRYCPFNQKIREGLTDHPMYQDIFQKYRILTERKLRHMRAFIDKYRKNGGEMTPELEENMAFFDK